MFVDLQLGIRHRLSGQVLDFASGEQLFTRGDILEIDGKRFCVRRVVSLFSVEVVRCDRRWWHVVKEHWDWWGWPAAYLLAVIVALIVIVAGIVEIVRLFS